MGQLLGRDAQTLGQNTAVTGALVEHEDKIGVFQNVLHFGTVQQVFDILRQAGRDTVPFPEAFINLGSIGRRLRFFQQQVELVLENTGGDPGVAVRGGALPEMLLDAGHDDFFRPCPRLLVL